MRILYAKNNFKERTMKKLLSLILVLFISTALILTSCGDDDGNESSAMNAESWGQMLSTPNFENYTLYHTTTMMGTVESATVKFADDKVQISGFYGTEPYDLVYTDEDAAEQKRSHEELFLALLSNFSNFVYDESSDSYKNPNPISVNIIMTQNGVQISAAITMTNGVVTIDEAGKLLTFDCNYQQTTTIPEVGPISIDAIMHMEFSNYGTTVISD